MQRSKCSDRNMLWYWGYVMGEPFYLAGHMEARFNVSALFIALFTVLIYGVIVE